MKFPFIATLILVSLFTLAPSAEKEISVVENKGASVSPPQPRAPKVTFIELGSGSCMPCKMMQPVMKNLETKYPKDLKVVLHDVWTDEGKPLGKKYGIRAIPTQVFLDASGKEISRHEGFFPQAEIEKILRAHGVAE